MGRVSAGKVSGEQEEALGEKAMVIGSWMGSGENGDVLS